MPTKLPEYLASGVPILVYAPAYSSVARYCRDQEFGLLVDSKGTEKLEAALQLLNSDVALRRSLTQNAVRLAREHHDLSGAVTSFTQDLSHNSKLNDIRRAERMRSDWDARARSDAFRYICSERCDWDAGSFFASGEEDCTAFVDPALSNLGFDPSGKIALDVGCGVGRLSRALAQRFNHVYALDISNEMLRRGRMLNKNVDNIVWIKGDGKKFSGLADHSLDFVFCYLVLQHLPTRELAFGYVHEMLRVLRPGGVFIFQFNNCARSKTMNWKGRLVWRVIDRLQEPLLGFDMTRAGSALASKVDSSTLAVGKTWRGAILLVPQVVATVQSAFGTIESISGAGSERAWCIGRKAA